MRSRKAVVVSFVLQVPLYVRGIIGFIGDAQVVRDLVTEGTWPHDALVGFLKAGNFWIALAVLGLLLFWWAVDWFPLRPKRGPPAPAESGSHDQTAEAQPKAAAPPPKAPEIAPANADVPPEDQRTIIAAEIRSREREIERLEQFLGRITQATAPYISDHGRWMSDQSFVYKNTRAMVPAEVQHHGGLPKLSFYEVPDQPKLLDAAPSFEMNPTALHLYVAADNHPYMVARMENMSRITGWLKTVQNSVLNAKADVARREDELAKL